MKKRSVAGLVLFLTAFLLGAPSATAQDPSQWTRTDQESQLERALAAMYRDCLFPNSDHFQTSIALARAILAPGVSSFIESNLAAIPLTPPSLEPVVSGDEIITTVTGFAPIFTESSATIGGGNVYVGANYSYLNLSRIRGEELSDIRFQFAQNTDGGDVIVARMPLDLDASVFTLYTTYGLTDRIDIGIALPLVQLSMERQPTTFEILGNDTGLLYGGFSNIVDYYLVGDSATIQLPGRDGITRQPDTNPTAPSSEAYLSTIAVRLKYRLPLNATQGGAAVLLDTRIPAGRSDGNLLGRSNFGVRLMLIGEYARRGGFKPYVNLGGQYWDGFDSSSLKFAGGFNQQLSRKMFFSFDLLGEFDLEANEFLPLVDELATFRNVPLSNIPGMERDHVVNAALGFQMVFSPEFHAYGSALFSLLNAGLQSSVAPTIGVAMLL